MDLDYSYNDNNWELTEATASFVKEKDEGSYRVVLDLLGKCYITGKKLIMPYEPGDEEGKIKPAILQVENSSFLLVYTSPEEATKADCFRVMEAPTSNILRFFWDMREEPGIAGLAVNYAPGNPPCFILKKDCLHIVRTCSDAMTSIFHQQHNRRISGTHLKDR